MAAPPISRASVPDQVFHRLARDIVAGRFAPGDRLPTQRALAAELGVNMASVREGVKRLEQARLVDVRHGDGMRVRDWRTNGGLDVLVHLAARDGALDPAVARAVFEARGVLLAAAARLAADRRSGEQAKLLRSLAEQLAAEPDDDKAQGLDFAFYAVLVEAAGNLVFSLVTNSIRDVYLARREVFRPIVTGRAELAPLYARAARAVGERDAAGAEAAVERLAAVQAKRLLESLS
jgi:GntR family transcriptional regulator, transcriptional repressor for pyruvate dehydrogenase complex